MGAQEVELEAEADAVVVLGPRSVLLPSVDKKRQAGEGYSLSKNPLKFIKRESDRERRKNRRHLIPSIKSPSPLPQQLLASEKKNI